jgi:hypothetical protein
MGTYTHFSVAGYPLIHSKSQVVAEAMTVFRENDKRVFSRRLCDRSALVWGDTFADDLEETETATVYACSTAAAVERLDIMGFTINRVRREFESGRQAILTMPRQWTSEDPNQRFFSDEVELLDSLSFDAYLAALRRVLTEGLTARPSDDHEPRDLTAEVRYVLNEVDDNLLEFFAPDVRCLIRAACEVAPRPSEVSQDITDLVDAGYYEATERVCQKSINSLVLGHLENSNRLVLTEGSTDTRVLKASLQLLYPHLSGYYSFLDFESARVPGGAGQLASLTKGFAAAGIGNRIIAIFDNDSAGRDAMRTLAQLQLPSNIAFLTYPDIELLRSYPTLGPSGNAELDVNGLAASIEMYFGVDVLRRQDGPLTPVQWKGYVHSIASYQGEVLSKPELQAAFFQKVKLADRNPAEQARQDWSGIDAILRRIFGAFED